MCVTNSGKINDIPFIEEFSDKSATAILGGRMKEPFVKDKDPGRLSPDGEPIQFIIDGVVVNSVSTGTF
jgi:hypothetical protein